MRPKAVFAVLGVLASVALVVVGLVGPSPAEADREDGVRAGGAVVGSGEVRAGNAVVDEDGARIESDSSADGDEEGSSSEEQTGEDGRNTPSGDDEVVLRMKGDEGVEFSGTCSVGDEEQEIKGQVPEEFTFELDGDELECEIDTEGDEGTLKMVLVSGNSRNVQAVSGDSTMKFTYSGNGISSSTISSSSGSSSVVNQSSSVVQSSSSSTNP